MVYDEGLAERIRDCIPAELRTREVKMFGGICFMVEGNMACGIIEDKLMLRLTTELVSEYRKEPYTSDMDFTSRPMPSMMYVEPDGIADDDQLRMWVGRAVEQALTLPPK